MAGTHNELSGTVKGTVIQANNVTLSGGTRPRGPVWMVPGPDRALVERTEAADRLGAMVLAGDPVVGVVGTGGFGKTTLVAQVCHRLRDAFPGGVLWVSLGEELPDPMLAEKINDLSELVGTARPTLADPGAAGHRLGELIGGREPTLLVVDDVWTASRLVPFLRTGTQVVATTRSRGALPATARVLTLGSLSPEESRSLLTLGVPGLTRTDRLIRLTGRWAILLALVNSAIRRSVEEGIAPDEAADLVAGQLRLDGPGGLDLDSADRRDHAVRATVEASLRRLTQTDRDRFLDLGVFPEDTDIPVEVVNLLWGTAGRRPPECRRLLRMLADLSLITLRDGALRLHDVLRAYLRWALDADGLTDVNRRLTTALCAEAPEDWARARPYALMHLAGHATEAGMVDPLLTDAGFLLAADQPGLLASLPEATTGEAKAAALAYQRVAHHLRDRSEVERPAYLELAARQVGASSLCAGVRAARAPWHCEWASWDPGPPHQVLTRHIAGVDEITMVPRANGQVLVFSRDLDGNTRIVDAGTNKNVDSLWPLPDETTKTECVPRSAGGHVFVVGTENGEVLAWQADSGEPAAWELPSLPEHLVDLDRDREPTVTPANPDDEAPWPEAPHEPEDLELGTDEHTERVLALDTPEPTIVWADDTDEVEHGNPGPIRHILWASAPSGPVVVIVRSDDGVWAVDATTGRRIGEPDARPPDTFELDVWTSPDDDHPRATVRQGGWRYTWDLRTGATVEKPDPPRHRRDAGTRPRMWRMTAHGGGTIRMTDTSADRAGPLVQAHVGTVSAMAATRLPDGRCLFATGGDEDCTVRLWDPGDLLDGGEPAKPVAVERIVAVGGFLVTGHGDDALRVWEAGRVVRELPLDGPPTALLAISGVPGEALVVTDTEGGPPRVWDLATGEEVPATLGDVTGRVIAFTRVQDGMLLLLTASAKTVRAWRVVDGVQVWQIERDKATAMVLPDGHIAIGGEEKHPICYDARTGRIWRNSNVRYRTDSMVGAVPGTEATGDRPVAAFIANTNLYAWDPVSGELLAETGWGSDSVFDSDFRRYSNGAVLLRLPDGSVAAAVGGPVLRLLRLVAASGNERYSWLDEPPCKWVHLFDIDLDTFVTALTSDEDGTLLAGTAHGIVRLRLTGLPPRP